MDQFDAIAGAVFVVVLLFACWVFQPVADSVSEGSQRAS